VSRNTIKSQVLSIYRKLDAASRDQAVGQARALGLLEG
jgi:ATP/maltotriose-dependent transcriptional regulator MalT